MKELNQKQLGRLYEKYRMIMGYNPGVADKFLLKQYAQQFDELEDRTTVECFIRKYFPNPRGLGDVPIELWFMK
jgi:hypothetical protein